MGRSTSLCSSRGSFGYLRVGEGNVAEVLVEDLPRPFRGAVTRGDAFERIHRVVVSLHPDRSDLVSAEGDLVVAKCYRQLVDDGAIGQVPARHHWNAQLFQWNVSDAI